MPHRLRHRLTFRLERWIQRGALHQLLLIAALIGLVALTAGVLALVLAGGFSGPAEAVWWAFLRLTDPGYLGDDEGTLLRIVSTIVTVLGYVLFMGSLIAILTQWLNEKMRMLESGLTPIAVRDHILILGWTNRTPTVVRELMLSEGRVRRFLRRRGARRLRIVILAEEVGAGLVVELREQLGRHWDERQIILRSGSSLRLEHLRRVNFEHASVIILPGADFVLGGAAATDTRVIKTLLSISNYGGDDAPAAVAEIFDAEKVPIARQAYQGGVEALAGDAFISRLIAQNVRHGGLSFVYSELLTHSRGNEVYVRAWPELAGRRVRDVTEAFPKAVVLGVVRSAEGYFTPLLNPSEDVVLEEEDRLVLIARTYEDSSPTANGSVSAGTVEAVEAAPQGAPLRRILLMGWSHKVRALLREFAGYEGEQFEIDVLSVVPEAERTAFLTGLTASERLGVNQLVGDYTLQADLERLELGSYDNIVFLGSDWLESGEESDARTVLGYVLLRAFIAGMAEPPEVLVELMDPQNAQLFQARPGEVIVSPLILSHMLAHVALRRELSPVFEELFGPGGAEILFRSVADYGLGGQEVDFRSIQRHARRHGETALGVRRRADAGAYSGGVQLNPSPARKWRFEAEDEIVVLTTY